MTAGLGPRASSPHRNSGHGTHLVTTSPASVMSHRAGGEAQPPPRGPKALLVRAVALQPCAQCPVGGALSWTCPVPRSWCCGALLRAGPQPGAPSTPSVPAPLPPPALLPQEGPVPSAPTVLWVVSVTKGTHLPSFPLFSQNCSILGDKGHGAWPPSRASQVPPSFRSATYSVACGSFACRPHR